MRAILAAVCIIACSACSSQNREGPDVTCADLANGKTNACAEGIIAYCMGGTVRYKVCTDSDNDAAKAICEQSWQLPGQYRCKQSDAMCFGCTGGN